MLVNTTKIYDELGEHAIMILPRDIVARCFGTHTAQMNQLFPLDTVRSATIFL